MRAMAELDRFMPACDARERHEGLIRAPADVVFEVALRLDMQSIPLARAIFWLREKIMRSTPIRRIPQGFLAELISLGWGLLSHRQGREMVMGAAVQPWEADVSFRAIPASRFAEFAEPGLVKIVWTLEAEPIGRELTRFGSETRARATDAAARRKFLAYWRWARLGIVPIRWLILHAVRREAERRYRDRPGLVARAS